MEQKTKFEIEIENFRKHFAMLKDKRIVIYGIGRRTATLISGINDYQVVGLLDKDPENIGREIDGIKVISLKDAERIADIIIINSDPTNYEIIYRRIRNTKLPVYYANGEKGSFKSADVNYMNNTYWDSSSDELKEQIDAHDVISFDLFDTLIMRKLFRPQDVFELVAKRKKLDFDFVGERQKAVASITEKESNINDIYDALQHTTGISLELSEELKQLEKEIEQEVVLPRTEMVQLLNHAISEKKQLYIVTDMYYQKSFIMKLLQQCDIHVQPDHVIISCEENKSKTIGNIWDILINKERNKKILHIGDHITSDIEIPKKYGIDTYYVMSAKEMMKNSSISELAEKVISLSDSINVGLLISRMFHNPFTLSETKGKVNLESSEEFGYCVFGAMMTRFIIWLQENAIQNNIDKLLFFARDGYFLIEDFNYLQQEFCKGKKIDTVYVPISRRLIYNVTIENEKDLWNVASFPYVGTFSSYIKSRFNVDADERTETENSVEVNVVNEIDKVMSCLQPYMKDIKKEINKEKKAYREYLQDHNICEKNQKNAVVDMAYYGTNQFYFQKFVQQQMKGYYFYACLLKENEYLKTCDMEACFNGKDMPEGNKSLVGSKSAFLESFLTAPYGMIRYIDDGKLVCEKDKMNQEMFHVKKQVNQGIKGYITDYMKLKGIEHERKSGDTIEAEIYADLLSGKCSIGHKILEGFYFDNDMVGGREIMLEV